MTPVSGELPPRRAAGLPRQQPPPEHNIVQNPALTRGLQQLVGSRQAHIAPALSDGLQPQITVADIRADPHTQLPLGTYAAFKELIGDGINVQRGRFWNPPWSGRIAVLRRLHTYIDAAPPSNGNLVYSILNDNGALGLATVINHGQRLNIGYAGIGIAPGGLGGGQAYEIPDMAPSQMGWVLAGIGITGGYFWESVPLNTATQYQEVLENFNETCGPRIALWPGSTFQVYSLDNNAHLFVNLWWDEYTLTP